MRRLLGGSSLVLGLFMGGCDSPNAVSCESFVDQFEALPCAAGKQPGVDCNAFADYPCDVTDYFDCLKGAHTCAESGELEVNLTLEGSEDLTANCADLLDCGD